MRGSPSSFQVISPEKPGMDDSRSHPIDRCHDSTRRLYVYLVSLIAAVGGFLFGYDLAVISGAQLFLQERFQLEPAQLGFATSSAILGCIIGPILGGTLSDAVGRRRTLIIAAALFGISAVGTALPKTILQFNVFRIIGGMGVGLASVVSPMYIAEIAPARIRGRLVTLNQFAIVIGSVGSIIVAYFLALYVSPGHWNPDAFLSSYLTEGNVWRWMFGLECVPILAFLIALNFIPQSPRWLMQKNRAHEALVVLTRIDGPASAEAEVKEISESLLLESEAKAATLKELWLPGIRIALLVGIALAVFQQWSGANALGFYAPIIFREAGFQQASDALFQTVLMQLFNIFCVILALWLVGRFKRRPILLVGTYGMVVGLTVVGAVFALKAKGMFVLLAMLATMLAYQISLAPLAWLIISEIFPTRVRAKGMGIASICLWISCYTLLQTFPSIKYYLEHLSGSAAGMFCVYAVVCLVAFVFCFKMVPETKDKTLEEIAKAWLRTDG
jgi:sugar porter (SP) family MFS transporter